MKKKTISILLAVAILMIQFTSIALGTDITITDPSENKFSGAVGQILGYVRWFGYAIAIGMLIYIGIKYVMASANEKADLKKGLINYVIGAVLIAGAATIAGWIFEISKSSIGE